MPPNAGKKDYKIQILAMELNKLTDAMDCLSRQNQDLIEALEDIVPKFKKSIIANGSDSEFADIACEIYFNLLEQFKGVQ